MQTDIFARVILIPSGDIYIAFKTKRVVKCTANNLVAFFSDPFMFHDASWGDCQKEANIVNPNSLSLGDIPGITLAFATDSGSVTCSYTVLFRLLFSAIDRNKKDSLMHLDVAAEIPAPCNERQFMLHIFSRAQELMRGGKTQFKCELNIPDTEREQFFNELVTCLSRNGGGPKASQDSEVRSKEAVQVSTDVNETVLPPTNYVPVKKFAELKGVTPITVHSWLHDGKIKECIQLPNGRWYVNPNAVIIDGRKTRKSRLSEMRRPKISAAQETYEDVQKRILEDGIVSDAVRPYIRKFKEALYYRNHYYHEVSWPALPPCLIIDVNPEYICIPLGKTNLALMQEGNAPVIPGADADFSEETSKQIPRYHLHHIGQKRNSPLAVIPSADHNNKKFSSFFHPYPHEKNLHDAAFESVKAAFWRAYAKMYTEYGSFQKIPYLNHKDKTPKYIKRQGGNS